MVVAGAHSLNMVTGLKAAAQMICALFQFCRDVGVCGWLGRLVVTVGVLRLWSPARASTNSDRLGGQSSKQSELAPVTKTRRDFTWLSGTVYRNRQAAAVALVALAACAPSVTFASPGCDYLDGSLLSSSAGTTLTGDFNTDPNPSLSAPTPFIGGAANFVSGDTVLYSYSSLNNARATVRRAPSTGGFVTIVNGATAAGNGSYAVTADHTRLFVVTQVSATGAGSVAFRMYCEIVTTQSVASTTAAVGSALSVTPVTAAYGSGSRSYAVSPTLPSGLSFDTGTGAITGTPSATSAATTYTVTASYSGGSGTSSKTFQLTVSQAAPTVSAISPTSGPETGSNAVSITGTGFLAAAPTNAVKFGATAVTYTIDSDTQITATAPAGSGIVDVTVTTPGGSSAISASDRYTYIPAPAVTAVSPDSGPVAGGSTVVLTGTNFTGATTVSFGGTPADDFTVDSATRITAISPAGTGTVDVRVTTASGISATTAADQFTYVAAPTISAASPTSGPTAGGTAVTLTGTNLTAATLTVDGASVAPTDSTATTVVFTTPAHAAGSVIVAVITTGGFASTSFTYVAPPVSSSFTASAVAYDAAGVTFSLAARATNSPTSYAVGSATTAQGGSVSVDSSGLVTYTAPTGFRGNDSFTFTATNPGGTSSPATVTVPVSNPTLASALVGSGTRGIALSGVEINTSGGRASYSCSTTPASGALPAGTGLNSDCTISGTPTASGSFTFTTYVTDSSLGTGPFTQATSALTLSIAAPTISLSPAAGALPGGAVGAAYSQSFVGSGGTASYSYVHSDGDLPPGLTLTGDTVSGMPTTKGSFEFDITTTDSSTVGSGGPYARTESYSIEVDLGTQTISFDPLSDISLSSSPPALSATASSGLAVSFASTTSTVCTVAGTTVTLVDLGLCSVTASQAGDTDWAAASDVVQSFMVTPGTLELTADAASGLQVGQTYSQTNTVSGGLAPYAYSLHAGAFVPGTTLDTATGTVSGTPTVAGTFSYIVRVADGQEPPVTAMTPVTTVTIVKGNQTISFTSTAPTDATAGGESYTIAATTSAGADAFLTVSYSLDASSTGCDVSGSTVTFTGTGTCVINANQAGDSNWNAATQIQQSFAVAQATPTLSVAVDNSTPTVGTSVTFTATLSGGASPSGTVTFKEGSATLGTGTISGTMASYSTATLPLGSHSITAEYAGDANNAATTSADPVAVTVAKAAPTVSVSADDTAPIAGTLVTFTATLSGGVTPGGTITFKDGSATLGTVPFSGTTATYSSAALSIGDHSITAEYSGDAGNDAASSPTLDITVYQAVTFTFSPPAGALPDAMPSEDYDQTISATGGTGTTTYSLAAGTLPEGLSLLTTGELTGPLDADAEVKGYSFTVEARDGNGATGTVSYTLEVKERAVTVTDQNVDVPAGSAPLNVNLEAGATGGPFTSADLTFVEPANAGTASIIRGEFAAIDPMALGWYLKFVPNPAYSGTVKVGFKLTSALGVSNTGTVTYTLAYDAPEVAEQIDGLVHGFIESRQSLISSTIKVPGLVERRRMETATDPLTTRVTPSETGLTGSFSTSLTQLNSAADYAAPFNIWVDGTLMLHNREQNDGRWGSFAMINFGADYLLSEKALLGLSFHYDNMTDPTDADAELTGNGWLVGPYASFEIGDGVFWDTSLLYGGSSNEIDTSFWDGSFATRRWMIDTSVSGQLQLDEATVLTPKLRAVYFSEKVEDYAVENGDGDMVYLEGFNEEQFRVSLGAEIARSFALEGDMVLTPRLGVTGGLSGFDGSAAFGSVSVGLSLQAQDAWQIRGGILLDFDGSGQKSVGAKAGISGGF
jgi:hypothetical protein